MKTTEAVILNLIQSGQISADRAEKCLEELVSHNRRETPERQHVAIVGIGFRLPGASNMDELVPLLEQKADMIRPFPGERRLQVLEHCSRAERARLLGAACFEGGFLDRIDLFDPARFGISPGEACLMAPEQRLSLTVAADALGDAGYAPTDLSSVRVGVYHGRSESEYHRLLGPRDPSAVPGNIPAIAASRISHHFNFGGPCLTVDTTCSSGLVALHLAREHLVRGECDLAFVGATHLILFPIDENASARIGSKTYRTKSFDELGDGTGYGEGAICLVLKRLEDAVADADRIYAVVHGSAMNHDGRSSSITAPNAAAQKACITAAWKVSGIDPSELRYVEAHGTGTPLGDPIEWQALTEALAEYTDEKRFCGIGSVKSNFGHLDVSAGLVGVLKLLVAFRRGKLPGTVHYNRPNPHLNVDDTGLYVVKETEPWERGAHPRLAAISSFGLSGTNCHAVVSEYVEPEEVRGADEVALPFLISASSKQALRRFAASCRAQLRNQNPNLVSFSYSLAMRRPAERERVVIVARDRAELIIRLAAVETLDEADVDLSSGGIYWPSSLQHAALKDGLLERVSRWLNGQEADFGPVFAGRSPRFCSYPAPERQETGCWSNYVEPASAGEAVSERARDQHSSIELRSIEECLQSKFAEASELIEDVIGPPSEQLELDLREYVGQIALRFFREFGALTTPGSRHDKDALFAELRLLEKYRKFYDVMLRMLARAGYVELDAASVTLTRAVELQDIDELCARHAARYPRVADCFEFPRYTAPYFRRVMTGQYSALRVMYPKGDLNFFQNTFTRLGDEMGTYLAKAGVQGLCDFVRQTRPRTLRLLEAGAGMGVLTKQILPKLQSSAHVEYWYTDIGNAFVQNAREQFKHCPFMKFTTYDISKAAQEQGLEGFDVVAAYNVVHTTASIRDTLRHMKTALAPGGFIFLIESAKNEDWATLSWGLLDGWWSFEDHDLRPQELMLSLEQWERVGQDCGFDVVYAYPKSEEQRRNVEKSIIVLGTAAPSARGETTMIRRGEPRSEVPEPPRPRVLPQPQTASSREERARAPGDADTVSELTAIWRDVLGLQAIGREEPFHDLGGDSLLAIKLVEEVDRRLGAHIDVSDIYAFPTIDGLASFLSKQSARPSRVVERPGDGAVELESILDAVLDDSLSLERAVEAIGRGRGR
jgi:polyketide synthase PksN